jgi:RNA polymerase sporulation-specific sigma factor
LIECRRIKLAKAGDEAAFEALARDYSWLMRSRARRYFLRGGEYEDLLQEAMIGFFKAVRDYRADSGNFRAFADLCITRQMLTAIKTASRIKHEALNSARSFDAPIVQDGGNGTIGDTIKDTSTPFDATLMETKQAQAILKRLKTHLSNYEYSLLILWLEGTPYVDIATKLDTMKGREKGKASRCW